MKKKKFKKGDSIILGNYGAGYIEKITIQEILDKKIKLFDIYFVNNEMRILIPVTEIENSDTRRPASKPKLYKILKLVKAQIDKSYEKEIKKKFEDGIECIDNSDIKNLGEVIFFLNKKNKLKPLSITEKRFFHQAITLISSEMAVINNITMEKSETKIRTLLSKC